MKNSRKKYLILIPAVLAALCSFAACRPKEEDKPKDDPAHTHTFNTTVWEYDGNDHWHPATCGHETEKGDKGSHNYTEKTQSEATCTKGAVVLYECACGYSYEDTTQPLGHDLQTVEAKVPTCEEDGYGEYKKCSRCDYVEGYKVFLKTGKHIYSTQTWEHDAISHWRPAICGCDRKGEEALHTFDADNKCECGFEIVANDAAIEATFLLEEKDGVYTVKGLTEAGKAQTSLEFPTYYKGKAVTSIAAHAFEENETVTEIKLSETITVIGREAFNGCVNLKTVTFANRLQKIEESAFGGCEALVEAKLPETLTDLNAYAFDGCTALKTVNLPKGLQTLGDQAFSGCSSLEKIDVPASITKINDNTFYGCTALSEVVLHEGTTSIGVQAFARCAALESIALPRGLTFIGQSAFRGTGLKEIELPSTVSSLGSYAFAECASLTKATLPSSLTFSFGGWFASSKALEEITIPFVGSEVSPTEAVSKAFGYIFTDREPKTEDKDAYVAAEEYGKTYYIPVALKKVTVLKGTVSEGAFDGCSQLEEIAVKGSVIMEAVEFEKCTAKITWIGGEPTPELSEIKLNPTNVEQGEEVTLSYQASAASVVTVSVKKGEEDAVADTDYTYNAETKTLVFSTQGTFTVTVTAKIGVTSVSKTATVTVTAAKPQLSDLTLAAKGNLDTEIELGFTADSESTITVTVKKGEADATAADYSYNAETKKITFKTPGNYTVTVKATRNEMDVTKSATIRIIDPNAPKPEITFTAGESSVTEGSAVALTANVTYASGTEKDEETMTVEVKQGENYVAADASLYELTTTGNKRFKPLVAGDYRITLTASNTQGGFSEKTVEITAEIAQITLAWNHGLTPVNGYLRVATGATGADLVYTVGGYAGGYNVTVEKDVEAAIGTLGEGNIFVSATAANTVTYKVVYTHKADSSVKQEITVKVSFVSDVANAPVLGQDPFGDTYGTIIPSTGLMMYFDVKDKDGAALTYADITYEIVSQNVTLSDKSSDEAKEGLAIVIEKLHGLENYPYILVKNFENNTATGTVTVKLTAEKDGATAAATKVFEIKPLAKDGLNENGSHKTNVEGLNDYIDAVTGGKLGAANYDKIISFANRQNSVASKEGLIISRGWAEGNITVVEPKGEDNFQVDFDYTPLLRRGDKTKVSFAICYRTGKWEGYNSSQTAFYCENNETDITAGYWGPKIDGSQQAGDKPECTIGTTIKIRIIHTVADDVVTFKYQWSTDGRTYHDWLVYQVNASSENANIGAPVYALQFNHEEGGYLLGNFKLSTAPKLEVNIAGTATVEEAIDLTYTAEGATVEVAVKKGDAAATAGDYTYNKDTNKIHFLTEGTYTVIVTATLNGMSTSVEKTVTVTAPAPTLTGVTLTPSSAQTEAEVTLAYTTETDGKTTVAVTVKKGTAAAVAGTDYTYTEATKTLVFKTAGKFTVTVTATRNGKTATQSCDITVTKAGVVNPTVTLTVTGGDNCTEGDKLAFTHTVEYNGETKATETLTVEIKGADDTFAAATEGTHYSYTENEFTPLVAGEFKITLEATTTNEGIDSKSVTVTAHISQITVDWKSAPTLTNGWLRVASGETGTQLEINVTGYTANYTVTVTKNGETVENAIADGKLTVQNTDPDTAEYKVVYVHNADDTEKQELTVKVSFVSSVTGAPVLGEDPFGGTYGKLIPGVGLVLYSNVEGEGVTISFPADKATNATVETMDGVGTYVYVANADNAKVAVKLTATKDGETAAATKTFEVVDMSLNDYIDGADGYDDRGAANYNAAQGALTAKQKELSVIAKDGFIAGRTEYTGTKTGDDLFVVVTNNKNNFYVDFDFTPYVRRDHNRGKDEHGEDVIDYNKYSFTINYRQESINGWIGSQVSFWSTGNDSPISSGYWGDKIGDYVTYTNPDVALGETVKIRIIHTVVGNDITFRYEWSKDGNTYTRWMDFKVPTDKNIGKPIYAIQFNQECGCFKIGNVEVKEGPEAPSVTLSDSTDVETPITLEYTVTNGATADVSFKKVVEDAVQDAVETTDYTYNTETKEIHFLKGGTYKVIVTATLNGMSVSTEKEVTVTVPAPKLSTVELKNEAGKIPDEYLSGDAKYTLTYTTDTDDKTAVEITVKKGEEDAVAGTDYTLTEKNKITFKNEGAYTITVKATRNEIEKTESVTVTVKDPNKIPDISFTVGDGAASGSVVEGSSITIQLTVTYKSAATQDKEEYAVTVERSGSYVTAEEALYNLVTNGETKSFTPKLAGKYRITFTATTQEGVTCSASVEVTATVANLTFTITEDGLTLQNGSVLVQSVATDAENPATVTIPYTLTGYTGGYELSISKDGNITWEEGTNQLTASYKGENAGGYIFTYKHKSDLADKALWKVFTVKVSFVADTANAITFGADPFGGTHSRLIPSTGHLLYFEAYGTDGNALTYDNATIKFSVVSHDVKKDGSTALGNSDIEILTGYEVGDMPAYPYLLVRNFGNNSATGTIVVQLKVTVGEGDDAVFGIATKTFEVKPLNGDSASANGTDLSKFIAEVAGEAGDIANYGTFTLNQRENMNVGKDGVVFTRDEWGYGGERINVAVDGSKNNFQVDYSLIPMSKAERISFAWKFITGSQNDNQETGHSAMYFDPKDGVNDVLFDAGYWSGNKDKDNAGPGIEFELGKKVYVRITHTVEKGIVTITYEGSLDGTTYSTFCSFIADVTSTKGDVGAPVYGIRFYRENDLGHLIVGNFKLTYLD